MQVKQNDCGWYNENEYEMEVQKPGQKSQQGSNVNDLLSVQLHTSVTSFNVTFLLLFIL